MGFAVGELDRSPVLPDPQGDTVEVVDPPAVTDAGWRVHPYTVIEEIVASEVVAGDVLVTLGASDWPVEAVVDRRDGLVVLDCVFDLERRWSTRVSLPADLLLRVGRR